MCLTLSRSQEQKTGQGTVPVLKGCLDFSLFSCKMKVPNSEIPKILSWRSEKLYALGLEP